MYYDEADLKLFLIAGLLLLVMVYASIGARSAPKPKASLHYQAFTLAAFDAHDITSLPTRVEISGYIAYIGHEADGDTHLWICDTPSGDRAEMKPGAMKRQHCAVAEIMPDLTPVETSAGFKVKLGEKVAIDGITRWDGEHKWEEFAHPVERIGEAK